MKNSIFNYIAMLCLFLLTTSGKIKKDVSVGKSDCKGVGFNCSPDKTTTLQATYVYDEPYKGNFSIEFMQEDVQNNPKLLVAIRNGKSIYLDESLAIPDDVRKALKIPADVEVSKGDYPFTVREGILTIRFIE